MYMKSLSSLGINSLHASNSTSWTFLILLCLIPDPYLEPELCAIQVRLNILFIQQVLLCAHHMHR